MSPPRANRPAAEKPLAPSILQHIFYSGIATLASTPIRVCLNQAHKQTGFFDTITKSYPYLKKSLGLNFVRGTLSTSLQSSFKPVVQEHAGFAAGVVASAAMGTLAAIALETPLMRYHNAVSPLPLPALWRFSLPLTALYFLRDIGFSMAVFAKDDIPSPVAQQTIVISAAALTGSLHKLAVADATRDLELAKGTVPDFRDGIRYTLRAMAQGNVYTHEAYQVKYKDPANYKKMAHNFFHVACGVNVWRFRYAFLMAFGGIYTGAKYLGTSGFFKQNHKPSLSAANTPTPGMTAGKN
jgi:hypothetical protein